jgi:hypothetical protein
MIGSGIQKSMGRTNRHTIVWFYILKIYKESSIKNDYMKSKKCYKRKSINDGFWREPLTQAIREVHILMSPAEFDLPGNILLFTQTKLKVRKFSIPITFRKGMQFIQDESFVCYFQELDIKYLIPIVSY